MPAMVRGRSWSGGRREGWLGARKRWAAQPRAGVRLADCGFRRAHAGLTTAEPTPANAAAWPRAHHQPALMPSFMLRRGAARVAFALRCVAFSGGGASVRGRADCAKKTPPGAEKGSQCQAGLVPRQQYGHTTHPPCRATKNAHAYEYRIIAIWPSFRSCRVCVCVQRRPCLALARQQFRPRRLRASMLVSSA